MAKKRTELSKERELFALRRNTGYVKELLPAIQNLTSLGYSESDIGVLLGYMGKNKRAWLNNLKHKYPDVKKAVENGLALANAQLVSSLYDAATGYDYQEETVDYKMVQDKDNPDRTKEIKIGKHERKKHKAGEVRAAMFLLINRLPHLFKNSIEVNKKEICIVSTKDEIEKWAAGHLENLKKPIEAEILDEN